MLGNVLRLIRIANNKTIKEASQGMVFSKGYISEVESGRKIPSRNFIEKASVFYNIPRSKIFLIDELQDNNNLDYAHTLKTILEYYVYEQKGILLDKEDSKTTKVLKRTNS